VLPSDLEAPPCALRLPWGAPLQLTLRSRPPFRPLLPLAQAELAEIDAKRAKDAKKFDPKYGATAYLGKSKPVADTVEDHIAIQAATLWKLALAAAVLAYTDLSLTDLSRYAVYSWAWMGPIFARNFAINFGFGGCCRRPRVGTEERTTRRGGGRRGARAFGANLIVASDTYHFRSGTQT
jgi:hypothetical protein